MTARRPLLLLLLAALLAPTTAGAEEPEIPVLAGVNTVTGTGAVSVDVVLPTEASLVLRPDAPRLPGWAQVSTTGSHAAVVLVSKTETFAEGQYRVNAFELHLKAPHGCSGDPSPAAPRLCLSPYNPSVMLTPAMPVLDQGSWLYAYPPGEYTLYLIAEPGHTATATFELRGLQGSASMQASDAATVEFDQARNDGAALASLNGSHTHVVEESGLMTMGMYHVGANPDVGGLFNYSECLTRGTPGPGSPNDCLPASQMSEDVVVGGQPVVTRPTFFAAHVGAVSPENSGQAAWQPVTLGPGLWTNTYRVQRGGVGPAVGTWAFWLELP
jgi:hypothetical protein